MNIQRDPIFSHTSMVIQVAVHGQGVALVNTVLAQAEMDSGRLVCPFHQILSSKNSFYLVCYSHKMGIAKIAAFVNG